MVGPMTLRSERTSSPIAFGPSSRGFRIRSATSRTFKQVARSSGSIGANYIEANEALGKKDFRLHVRISRKESKETRYWLRLLDTQENTALDAEREGLIQESTELMLILAAILRKSE